MTGRAHYSFTVFNRGSQMNEQQKARIVELARECEYSLQRDEGNGRRPIHARPWARRAAGASELAFRIAQESAK